VQQPGNPRSPPGASDYVRIGRLSVRLRKQAYDFAKNSASRLERFVRLSALFRGASRRPSKQSLFLSCQDSFAWATLRLTHSCQRLKRPPVPSRIVFPSAVHGPCKGAPKERAHCALPRRANGLGAPRHCRPERRGVAVSSNSSASLSVIAPPSSSASAIVTARR
jgi:hypothetical protein